MPEFKSTYPLGTPLKEFVQTGDLIFTASTGIFGKVIRKVTDSMVNHVQIVLGKRIFDTDGEYGKAGYRELSAVTRKGMIIMRSNFLVTPQKEELTVLAEKYKGIRYDYWDVALNLILSPLSNPLRKRLITFLGTKAMMKCDELVMRLLYEVSLKKELRWFEGNTPKSFLAITLKNPLNFHLLYWNP